MVDWTFYSPTIRLVSAGDLLKAIPSDRIWRLERAVLDQGEEILEMVRAAEQLLALDVRVRLQNDPTGALSLRVRDPNHSDRTIIDRLKVFSSRDLAVIAELQLSDAAMQSGHLDICDDVLAGLEALFPGGFALSRTGELARAAEIAAVMTNERSRISHIDAAFFADSTRRDFIGQQLMALPGELGPRLIVTERSVAIRTRMPAGLSPQEAAAICNVTMELAKYAQAGHVRFRERGMWRDAVTNIGASVAPLPGTDNPGMLGRLTRFLRPK